MKIILLGLFFLFSSSSDLNAVRTEFTKILSQEDASPSFVKRYSTKEDPLIDAYVAGARCIAAGTLINPYAKYREFQNGSKSLDVLILKNLYNPEMRYIRLLIQLEAPSFLGYDTRIADDLKIFSAEIAAYKFCTLSYRKIMLEHLRKMLKSNEHRVLLQTVSL